MLKDFTPDEREIFAYIAPDGSSAKADPLRIRRLLSQATHGRLDEYYDAAITPTVDGNGKPLPDYERLVFEQLQAQEKLIAATAYAFGVPLFDPATGRGVPEQWVWDTCLAFDEWIQKKSESGLTTSTS